MIPGWLDAVEEEEVATCLCGRGSVSPGQLAERLGVSERCAISYICLLASDGRLTIERVSLPPEGKPSRPSHRGQDDGVLAGSAMD